MTEMQRKIIDTARTWIGVPWRHQGRSRAGVDCIGLGVVVGRELGLAFIDTIHYPQRPDLKQFVLMMRQNIEAGNFTQHKTTEIEPADFVVFLKEGVPHAAIVADGGAPLSIIQSITIPGRVAENIYDARWIQATRWVLRHKGVEACHS